MIFPWLILDVRDAAPKFIKPLENTMAIEGNAGRFECEVSALSEPLITWFRGKQELIISIKYKMLYDDRTYTLIVQDSEFDDIDEYTCKAVNSYGHATSSASLDVQCELFFIIKHFADIRLGFRFLVFLDSS